MKKLLSFVILLCLLPSALAVFSVDVIPVKDKIALDDQAQFRLEIENLGVDAATYRVTTLDYPRWSLQAVPQMNPITIKVDGKETGSLNILVDPNQNYLGGTGSHSVNIQVHDETNDVKTKVRANVGITSLETENKFVPTVVLTDDFPQSVDPSEPFTFSIMLDNQNDLEMEDVRLIVRSATIDEEILIDIAAGEEKVIDFEKKLDPKLAPQEDIITFALVYNDKNIFVPKQKTYRIASYSELTQSEDVSTGFLSSTRQITFTNEGNVAYTGNLEVYQPAYKILLTSITDKAEHDGEKYVIETNLAPFQSATVIVKTNYLGPVIIILALILLVVLLYVKRSPLIVRKEITETDVHEASISNVKVMITVKNRSNTDIKEISIIDKLPKLLDLEKTATIRSLQPSKMKKNEKHETLILWEIDELQPGEERVINYALKSNLKILGGLTLQHAMGKYNDEKGKEQRAFSKRVSVKIVPEKQSKK